MSDSLEGKIKLAFFLSIIGVTLSVLGMGTEFWAELAQPKDFSGNHTCQMAHYGLWKGCVRTLWVADVAPERTSCGPAELPGGEVSGGHASLLPPPNCPEVTPGTASVWRGTHIEKGLIGIYVRPQQNRLLISAAPLCRHR